MNSAWEQKMWQELAGDRQFALGYKTSLRGAAVWVGLAMLTVWSTNSQVSRSMYELFGILDLSGEVMVGTVQVMMTLTNLCTIAFAALFGILLFQGKAWAKWLALVQGAIGFFAILLNIMLTGISSYFGSLFLDFFSIMGLITTLRSLLSWLMPVLYLLLCLWMNSSAVQCYCRKLTAIKSEKTAFPPQPPYPGAGY